MAKSFSQFLKGLLLRGESSDPSDNLNGSLWYNSSTNRLKGYLESAVRTVVSEDQSQTLTNKTLSGNTATNLVNGAGTLDINSSGTVTVPNATDTLVGKNTSDTLTNKTLDNSNTATLKDANVTIQDDDDVTKQAKFQASGITAGQTRTFTFPDASTTLVGNDNTQTLTNKTLTSPVINSPTGITKSDVGLSNVDNTSDATKNAASVTLTNKTLDNTNTVTIKDANLTIQDDGDTSKQLKFQVSGVSASTTRTLTVPDANTTVVGTDATQTLTNKTIGDAITLTDISTPATPSAGFGKIYFKSDGFLYQLNENGTESKVGSGSGLINYISANPDAESTTTGWATFSNAAANIPTSGIGGTATGLTFSRSTSSPLRGSASFSIVQSNSTNIQGKGVSYAFSIDSADQAKALSISFDYNASSTFVASDGITAPLNDGTTSTNAGNSDIEVFIYDVTNAVLISVAPQTLLGKGSNNFSYKGIFQTASNSTSYRLILYAATASANATGYTLKYDNVYVGPQLQVQGSPITDYTSFTPTGAWVSNTAYSGLWRRVGDSLEYIIKLSLTGAPTSAGLTVNFLPSGLAVDTTKLPSTSGDIPVGWGYTISAGASYEVLCKYNSSTSLTVLIPNSASTSLITSSAVTQALPATYANGDSVYIRGMVPIAGWSSNVLMSNDAATRPVGALYNGTPTGTIDGAHNITFPTKQSDTHNSYSSGVYTIPVSGLYNFAAAFCFSFTSGSFITAVINKNGSVISANIIPYPSTFSNGSLSAQTAIENVPCVAGDTITVYANANGSPTFNTTVGYNYFSVAMSQGPAQIATNETVAIRYYDTSATAYGNGPTTVGFNTKEYDTHGAFASNTFTVPIPGKYKITTNFRGTASPASANELKIHARKNASTTYLLGGTIDLATGNQNYYVAGSSTLQLLAGDTIDIRLTTTMSGNITSTATADEVWVEIIKVGNY